MKFSRKLILGLTSIALSITLSIVASSAEASFFRFWRGSRIPGLSSTQFQMGLNQSLLPATGRLAGTEARLRSYQPVLLPPESISAGFPDEVALVEYESEASYKAFRSTAAGQAYGDLHWNFFDKDHSGSLVPEQYRGVIEFEHAYDAVGTEVNWYHGIATFRVFQRSAGFSDEEFKSSIRSHIEHLLDHQVKGLLLLATQQYVMEYALWENTENQELADATTTLNRNGRAGPDVVDDELVEITSRTVMNTLLQCGRQIEYGMGLRYR